MPFVTRIPVRFGDVDFARIAYYPRLLHLLHVAFEDLSAQALNTPYAALMEDRMLGFPTVRLDCEFVKPIRFGEILEVSIAVKSIGRSSVEFEDTVRVEQATDVRARVRIKRVAVDMRTMRPVAIPEDLRHALQRLRD